MHNYCSSNILFMYTHLYTACRYYAMNGPSKSVETYYVYCVDIHQK